jgi:hypothetical protein
MIEILRSIGYFGAELILFSHDSEVDVCNITLVKEVNFLKSWMTESHFIHMGHHHIQNFIQSATVINVAVFDNDLLAFEK